MKLTTMLGGPHARRVAVSGYYYIITDSSFLANGAPRLLPSGSPPGRRTAIRGGKKKTNLEEKRQGAVDRRTPQAWSVH